MRNYELTFCGLTVVIYTGQLNLCDTALPYMHIIFCHSLLNASSKQQQGAGLACAHTQDICTRVCNTTEPRETERFYQESLSQGAALNTGKSNCFCVENTREVRNPFVICRCLRIIFRVHCSRSFYQSYCHSQVIIYGGGLVVMGVPVVRAWARSHSFRSPSFALPNVIQTVQAAMYMYTQFPVTTISALFQSRLQMH